MIFDGTTAVEKGKNKDYHFTDMTNQAISYVRTLNSLTPDKPFFVYYAQVLCIYIMLQNLQKNTRVNSDGWQALRVN